MKKALLIAEKPDLMRQIKAVYEKYGHEDDIEFISFLGHVTRLYEPHEYNEKWSKWDINDLPIIPERFMYKAEESKIKYYENAKKKLKEGNYDYIINGCDSGREGEAIFHNFLTIMNTKIPVKRLWLRDLTDTNIKHSLDNLLDSNELWLKNMKDASQLRGYFDWEVGINLSRAASLISNQKINLGRVMTPTLKIIVDKELEIKNFKPTDYWEIECDFEKYKGTYFYTNEEGKEVSKIHDKSKAKDILSSLGDKGEVISINSEKVVKNPPELYSLATLQNDANEIFGYTMSETLEIAQSLYEKKYLSYPRTDSKHITKSIAKEFEILLDSICYVPSLNSYSRAIMSDEENMKSVLSKKRYVDDEKVSDHYAIIVTSAIPDIDKFSEKEKNIYTLVAKRILAIFMDPFVTSKTTIITDVNGHKFKTTGNMLEDLGYRKLYDYKFNNTEIPKVLEKDILNKKEAIILDKKTTCPKRITDSSLNKMMEGASSLIEDEILKKVLKKAKGIGTSATRAQIVEKLVSLKMVERNKKLFAATDYGINIIEQLKDFDITSLELTAIWEEKLTKIESNEYKKEDFYNEMLDYVKGTVDTMKNTKINIKNLESATVLGKCPICEGEVIQGKNYYYCSKYSRENEGCSFIIRNNLWGVNISKNDVKNLIEGKSTRVMNFESKKDNQIKKWSTALKYDVENKKIVFDNGNNVVTKCSECEGDIIESKNYYLCSNYKKTCNVIIPKNHMNAAITKKDVKLMIEGKETKEKEFSYEKDGQKRIWKTSMKYNAKENKIELIRNSGSEKVGICPKCKCEIKSTNNYYLCSNYKEKCNFIIPKIYKGSEITKEDLERLIDGKITDEKTFTWNNGKEGKARLIYDGNIKLIF